MRRALLATSLEHLEHHKPLCVCTKPMCLHNMNIPSYRSARAQPRPLPTPTIPPRAHASKPNAQSTLRTLRFLQPARPHPALRCPAPSAHTALPLPRTAPHPPTPTALQSCAFARPDRVKSVSSGLAPRLYALRMPAGATLISSFSFPPAAAQERLREVAALEDLLQPMAFLHLLKPPLPLRSMYSNASCPSVSLQRAGHATPLKLLAPLRTARFPHSAAFKPPLR
jgi:hypothetical protein